MRRELLRLLHVDLEERAHDAVGLLRHARHAVVRVEPVVEERLQLLVARGHLGRVLDQARLHAAHVGERLDPQLAQAGDERGAQIAHQTVDHAAHPLVVAHVGWCAGRHLGHRLGPQARAAQILRVEHARLEAVVDVVRVVGDLVGEVDDLCLQARRQLGVEVAHLRPVVARRVLDDALAHLPGEVEAPEGRVALLEHVHDTQALRVVVEAAVGLHEAVERALAGVAEGRVAEVVRQRDRLGQVLVEPEGARQRAGHLRGLDRVREPRPVVVALVVHEHLRLVLEAAEGGGVDDAVAVALEGHAEGVFGLGVAAAARVAAPHRVGREGGRLARLELGAGGHRCGHS